MPYPIFNGHLYAVEQKNKADHVKMINAFVIAQAKSDDIKNYLEKL